jgi:hypothetical protein
MTLDVVHQPAHSLEIPLTEPLRQHLTRAAVVVVVLGVLPFAWDAGPAWQMIGTLVSVAVVVRALQLVWRAVFSTDPRHLVHG